MEEENGRTGRRTPQIPSLCSSLSHSTIAHRVVCNDIFRLYAWLAGLFGFDWPYPGLRTSRSRQLRCGKEEVGGKEEKDVLVEVRQVDEDHTLYRHEHL